MDPDVPLPCRLLTKVCRKTLVARDQSYMPRQLTSARHLRGLWSRSSMRKMSYSKSRLQRRKFSSRYVSMERSCPPGRAKRGSFSKAEKMVFWKCRRQDAGDLEAKGGISLCSYSYRLSRGRRLRGTHSLIQKRRGREGSPSQGRLRKLKKSVFISGPPRQFPEAPPSRVQRGVRPVLCPGTAAPYGSGREAQGGRMAVRAQSPTFANELRRPPASPWVSTANAAQPPPHLKAQHVLALQEQRQLLPAEGGA